MERIFEKYCVRLFVEYLMRKNELSMMVFEIFMGSKAGYFRLCKELKTSRELRRFTREWVYRSFFAKKKVNSP